MKIVYLLCDKVLIKANFGKNWKKYVIFLLGVILSVTCVGLVICGQDTWINPNELDIGRTMKHITRSNFGSVFSYLFALLTEAIDITVINYKTWSGCYTSYFFSSLQPFFINRDLVWITPILLIGVVTLSSFYFSKVVLCEWLDFSIEDMLLCWLIMINLMIQWIPQVYSAFYWFNGSFYNTAVYSAAMVYIALLIKVLIGKWNNHRFLWCILILLLAIFMGGGNYSTSLCLLLGLLLKLIDCVMEKDKNAKYVLFSFSVLLLFFMVNVLAPGNTLRATHFTQRSILSAIVWCFMYALRQFIDWINFPVVMTLFFLALYCTYVIGKRRKYTYRYPILVMGVVFCFFSATYASVSYAEAGMPPVRQGNIQYWFLLICILICLIYVLGWIDTKWHYNDWVKRQLSDNSFKALVLCGAIMIIMFTSWKPDRLTMTVTLKSIDQMDIYREEVEARYYILEDESIDECYFTPFTEIPDILDGLYEVYEDSDNWINSAYAKYYDKELVAISGVE